MSEAKEGAACGLSSPSPGTTVASTVTNSTGMTRGQALGMLGAALVGLPWIGVGVAALGNYLGVPSRAFSGAVIPDEVPAGLVADLADGVPKAIMFGDETVYVVKNGSDIRAFSGTCPHAGCLVALPTVDPITNTPPTKHFKCPCHGGTFDFAGKVISGPPPRGLFEHVVKVSMERVIVGKLKDS
jgi:succinate dehydrogenase / fumarate reductase, iron-sulfur subunit